MVLKKVKPFFKKGSKSLHFILSLNISLFALAAMAINGIILYNKFVATLTENVMTSSVQMVGQVANTISSYVKDMIEVSDSVVYHKNAGFDNDKKSTLNLLDTTLKLRNDIVTFSVYDSRGNLIMVAPRDNRIKQNVRVTEQIWYKNMQKSQKLYHFSPPHVQNLFENQYVWVVTLSRYMNSYDGSFPANSVFAIDMNFSSIDEYCSNVTIGKRGYVFIMDENNNIIYHPQQQMIYAGIKQEDINFIADKKDGAYTQSGSNNIVVISSLKYTNWKVVGITYMSDMFEARNGTVKFISVMFGIACLFVFCISLFVSMRISKPIVNLTNIMEDVVSTNLDIHCHEGGFYEVECLSQSFNHMIDRINELMDKIKAEEKELRKTELKALQAQINPHFLYNTLESISWMCEQNDGPGAVKMVSALASLFRIGISKGNEVISIREELTHAESYLIIQGIRYKNQFEYTIEADESLLAYRCLKITLQPILENAIYHGIDRMVDKGLIQIKVKDKGEKILMQVIDNGLGMSEDVLNGILSHESSGTYGIGVKNVNTRIQIYFGKDYGLHIESELDVGTCVNIWIPKIEGVINI